MALQNISLDALSKVTLVDGNFIATDGGKETTLSFSRMLLHLGVHLLDNTRAAFNTQFAVAQEQVNAMTDLNAIMQLMTNYKNCFGKDGDVTDDIKTQNKNLFTSLERVTINVSEIDLENNPHLKDFVAYYSALGSTEETKSDDKKHSTNSGIDKLGKDATLIPVTCYKTTDGRLIPIMYNYEEGRDVLHNLDTKSWSNVKFAQLAYDDAKVCELYSSSKNLGLLSEAVEILNYHRDHGTEKTAALPDMANYYAYKQYLTSEQQAVMEEYFPSLKNITENKSGLIANYSIGGNHVYTHFSGEVMSKEVPVLNLFGAPTRETETHTYSGWIPSIRRGDRSNPPDPAKDYEKNDNFTAAVWSIYESVLNEPLAPNGLTLGDTLKRQKELENTSGGFDKNTLISSADMKKLEDFMKKYPTALRLDLKTLPVVNNEEISTLTANLQTAQSTLATLNEQQGMRVNQSMSKSSSMLQTPQTLFSTVQQTTQSAAGTGG